MKRKNKNRNAKLNVNKIYITIGGLALLLILGLACLFLIRTRANQQISKQESAPEITTKSNCSTSNSHIEANSKVYVACEGGIAVIDLIKNSINIFRYPMVNDQKLETWQSFRMESDNGIIYLSVDMIDNMHVVKYFDTTSNTFSSYQISGSTPELDPRLLSSGQMYLYKNTLYATNGYLTYKINLDTKTFQEIPILPKSIDDNQRMVFWKDNLIVTDNALYYFDDYERNNIYRFDLISNSWKKFDLYKNLGDKDNPIVNHYSNNYFIVSNGSNRFWLINDSFNNGAVELKKLTNILANSGYTFKANSGQYTWVYPYDDGFLVEAIVPAEGGENGVIFKSEKRKWFFYDINTSSIKSINEQSNIYINFKKNESHKIDLNVFENLLKSI